MSGRRTVRLATRGSRLALAQSNLVGELLQQAWPDLDVKLVTAETAGDLNRETPLGSFGGGDGVFTRGVEVELLARRAELAVHSLKDLPTTTDPQLVLAAFPRRGSVGDVLVSPGNISFDALPSGALVGTSSPRRQAQVLAARPDLKVWSVRGNVDTRLRRLEGGQVDALILAAVGLERLRLQDLLVQPLPFDRFLPAVGQGALAVQCRVDDTTTQSLISQIDDADTRAAVTAERVFLRAVGGGCRVPIAAYGEIADDRLVLTGFVAAPDGRGAWQARLTGSRHDPDALGQALAAELLGRVDPAILAAFRDS